MRNHQPAGRIAHALVVLSFVAAGWTACAEDRDAAAMKRTAWFNEAKFGMFIHWGPFAVQGNDPKASYDYFAMKESAALRKDFERYAAQFNPSKFDAAAWMGVAKSAGMKYVVFTSKHHDGYCMFDSAFSDYTSMKGAPRRDYVRELIPAARSAGLHIGFYYSMLDWKHPDYTQQLPKFVEEYLFGQVRELCTNYGPIDCLWFDGEWDHPLDAWRSPELARMIRTLQPDALINDRLGKGERGVTPLCDFYTREQPSEVNVAMGFEHQAPRPWEACMTIGDFWQFSLKDTQFKSVNELIGILIDVVSRGGNLLLNVGPSPDGEIPPHFVERLRGMGAWLAVNGESIYGTARSPFGKLPVGKCTAKGNRLYLFLDSTPAAPVILPGLNDRIVKAAILGSSEPVAFDNAAKTITPPEGVAPGAWRVIAIDLEGAPAVLPMSEAPANVPAPADLGNVEERLYRSAMKQAHHLLAKVHPWAEDATMKLITESKSDEHWIRPNTGTVLGFAFLRRFGPYDAAEVGVSREELLEQSILPMMRYLCATHATGTRATSDGKRWGDQWQSAHWAQMLGRAAWWIWSDLPAELRQAVRAVLAHEADRIAGMEPPHQLARDTKAEENAWNSQVLSVAVLLMPEDARRPQWETAFQRRALSSFLRPADEHSTELVDGRSVAEQFTGANIYDDFTLENHDRIHPDYMSTFILSMGCVVDCAMSGRTPPEAVFHNVSGLYENLKWFSLPSGGFVYPNGQDWGLFRDPQWIYVHVMMAAYCGDPEAWGLAKACLETQERMQARSTSGSVFLDEEYFFPSTLPDLFSSTAKSWLALRYHGKITERPFERLGVLRMEGGKIILNRTPSSVHTFSWGAQLMGQVIPLEQDRMTSPQPLSGIGHIRLAGKAEALPVHVRNVAVSQEKDRFTISLEIDHGENAVRAFLRFESTPDGLWHVSEKLLALKPLETEEVATGLIAILNNPHWVYERGERRIAFGDTVQTVRSGSGAKLDGTAATIRVDDAIIITGKQPLNASYRGAIKAERSRFSDELYLNCLSGRRSWAADQVLSEYEASVRCPVREN